MNQLKKTSVFATVPDAVLMLAAMTLAVTWFGLGFNSDNVPWFSEPFWIIGCGMAAGSALSVAVYRSLFALRSYVTVTIVLGVLRSGAYLSNSSGGPALVWLIIALTTLFLYLAVLHGNDDSEGKWRTNSI